MGGARTANHDHGQQVISYLHLRRAIGFLGILFPVLLASLCWVAGDCDGLEDSISDYYHTEVRDLFVGILFAIGWFLYSYRGYERIDDIAANVACLCALAVALFPTNSPAPMIRSLHSICALGLFLVLIYFSGVLFRKGRTDPTPEKRRRNRIYLTCAWIMAGCIALTALYTAFGTETILAHAKPVFWLESIALWAFGLSWITKGEVICPDRED